MMIILVGGGVGAGFLFFPFPLLGGCWFALASVVVEGLELD